MTLARSSIGSTGLVIKSSAPQSIPVIFESLSDSDVTSTIGINWVSGCDFNVRQTSKPDMPGIITSSKIISGSSFSICSSASIPFVAFLRLYFIGASMPSKMRTLRGSSSTIRIFGCDFFMESTLGRQILFYRFNKLMNINWFG